MLYNGPGGDVMALDALMAIRVPEGWRRQVKAEAALRGMTISSLIRAAVDYYLKLDIREADGRGEGEDAVQEP